MLSAHILIWFLVKIEGYLKKKVIFGLQQERKYYIWRRWSRNQIVTAKFK